jgi:hypothetical protein
VALADLGRANQIEGVQNINLETLSPKIFYGGEGGIRTHDTLAGMPHFECGAFDHSATSPHARTLALRG